MKLIKSAGLDGFAITDHDSIEGVKEMEGLSTTGDFIIIPGIEVTTKHGHVLGLGVRELIPKGLPADETVELIKERGGIAVAAHPFWLTGKPGLVHKAKFDAIESFNSRAYFLANRLAYEYAKRNRIPVTAGSDGHAPDEIGLAWTSVNCGRNAEEVLEEIRSGRTKTSGRNFPFLSYAKRGIKKGIISRWRGGGK